MKNRKTPSSNDYSKQPDSSFDLINKYGTYEIQPTADRADYFPAIAQGLPTQPTNRNKRIDHTKSKKHDSKQIWDNSKL